MISYTRIDRASTSHFGDIFLNGEVEANNLSAAQYMSAYNTGWYNVSNIYNTGNLWTRGNNGASNHFNVGSHTALNYLMTDRHKMVYGISGGTDADSTDDGVVLLCKRGKITAALNRFDYDTNSGSIDWMDGSVVVMRGISNEIPEPVTFIPETRIF